MALPLPQPAYPTAARPSTLAEHALMVERVIQAMRAHIAAPLSLEEMAEIACLSPFHFNRIFRALVGIPPGEFLSALRLDTARRRLLTTSLSVTDVCFDLGYSSLGTFTTRFKQLTGLSPLQLRQLGQLEATPSLEPRDERAPEAQRLLILHPRGVSGTITAPDPFTGIIFLGLFPRPIPQSRPVACVTLAALGRYQIAPVPDGRYYLFAAAVPRSLNPLSYLAAETGLLVAVAEQPVLVCGGRASAVDLALRPRHVADPPILVTPPSLLASPAAARLRLPC